MAHDKQTAEAAQAETARLRARIHELEGTLKELRRRHGEEENAHSLLRALINHLPIFVYAKDTNNRFIMANDAVARLMGAESGEELLGKTDTEFYLPEQAEEFQAEERHVMESGEPMLNKDEPATDPDGKLRWILTTKVPLRDDDGTTIGLVGIGKDITNRKRLERERDSYIEKLQEALASVRTLRGLLPICASCKKIRDDEGYWHRVEHYVKDRTHAEFSHSICPDCAKELYPDWVQRHPQHPPAQHPDGHHPHAE